MIKRIIFDVDGTLITGVNFVASIEATLKRLNIYSKEKVKYFLEAISTYENLHNSYNKKDYLNHFGKYLGVKLEDNFLSIFFDELKSCVPLNNIKLIDTITKLSKKYDLVLLTNYFKESQLNRLNTMGIGNLFSNCYGEELIKPNKDIYIKACGNFQLEECVVIGDDLYLDIEVPQSLGINAIFVNTKKLNDLDIKVPIVDRVEDITLDLIERIIINKN